MKKKYLLTLFLLTISLGVASAQSSYVGAYNIHSTAKHTLIREVSYPSFISCVNSGRDSVTFTYTNQNNECYEKVFKGYWINDFIVVNDTLFFCGRTADAERASRGIVGFFKFDSCFQHIDSIYVYKDFFAGEGGDKVNNLAKIGYFRTLEGFPHIVCIGGCNDNTYPCLIDIYETFGSSSECGDSIEYKYIEGNPPFANMVDKPFTSTLGIIRWDTVAFTRSQTHVSDLCPK